MPNENNATIMTKMTAEEYEFRIATVNETDIDNAIKYFETKIVPERASLYFREAIMALKFVKEILV